MFKLGFFGRVKFQTFIITETLVEGLLEDWITKFPLYSPAEINGGVYIFTQKETNSFDLIFTFLIFSFDDVSFKIVIYLSSSSSFISVIIFNKGWCFFLCLLR